MHGNMLSLPCSMDQLLSQIYSIALMSFKLFKPFSTCYEIPLREMSINRNNKDINCC